MLATRIQSVKDLLPGWQDLLPGLLPDLFDKPPLWKPARQLRTQIAHLRLEFTNAVDERKR